MGLVERLRKAGLMGKETAHRGVDFVRETWEENASRLRRRMRIHPKAKPQIKTIVRWSEAAATHQIEQVAALQAAPALISKQKKAAV